MSAFCRDCLADAAPHAARCGSLRLAAIAAASRTRAARDRPRRLRRLLRHDRKTRRSLPRRRAGHRRRRPPRRRRRGLLRRPHLRREVGDADVRGAAAVSARPRHPPQHGKVCPRRPRGSPVDAGLDAAGRAAVDRRSVPRPFRHRAAAWAVAGQGAGPLCRRCRKETRHHRLHRSLRQQVPRQDRLRPRQAAGLCGARLKRSAGIPGAEAGELYLRRRQGERGAARP